MARAMLLVGMATGVLGHGLMEYPPSRMQLCGVDTKPDRSAGTKCEAAISGVNSAYNFMSVLTHTKGRKHVRPLPENLCGFNAEPWHGKATPWDKPIDWPTVAMQPGRQRITWNIQWGNHFSDTEDFVYWITKPDFVYKVGTPLKWSDFEDQPFCDLGYNDNSPNANPDVMSVKAEDRFHTYCNVPARSGRHVIYGEWGRNQHTYERFHGCIDGMFSGGGGGAPPTAPTPPTTPTAPTTPTTPPPYQGKQCTTAMECRGGTGCYFRTKYMGECRKNCPNGWECSVY